MCSVTRPQLITIRKTTSEKYSSPFEPHVNDADTDRIDERQGGHIPAHRDFREKYFRGFKKEERSEDGEENT